MTDHSVEETSVVFVQDSCGVHRERAVELLEAGSGSVERAVEIHFQGQAGTKRKQSPASVSASPSKQATLVSFFGKKSRESKQEAPTNVSEQLHAATGNKRLDDNNIVPPKKKKPASLKQVHNTTATDPRLQYGALANAFAAMVDTTKRLAKLDALKTVLMGIVNAVGGIHDTRDRTKDGDVLCRALELILGAGNIKLQVSGSAVSKAVLAVTGASSTKLREAYRKTGDLGDAAEQFMRNQRLLVEPKPLTIVNVHDVLQQIAAQEGKGSQNQRQERMVKLLESRNEVSCSNSIRKHEAGCQCTHCTGGVGHGNRRIGCCSIRTSRRDASCSQVSSRYL